MARLPQASSSTATLIETGRRACRLCDRAGNGAQKYAGIIVSAGDALTRVTETTRAKTFDRITSYDAAVLADSRLDDAVREAFRACEKYDRNSQGAPVLEKAFPGGVFTPIVMASRAQKRALAARIIASFTGMDSEGGQLTGIAKELDSALAKAAEAQEVLEKSVLEQEKNEALDALARKEYMDKYNAIYHKACGDIGRTKANKLFPLIRSWKKKAAVNPEPMALSISAAA
jgi:hypothetical protein